MWSGEKEGELGSVAFVKQHFGNAEAPTKDFDELQAYWNIDDFTGFVRGALVFGPAEAGCIRAQYVKPFEDLGIFGASASIARVAGGSDRGAFAVAGLPGIGTQQDNIEYTEHRGTSISTRTSALCPTKCRRFRRDAVLLARRQSSKGKVLTTSASASLGAFSREGATPMSIALGTNPVHDELTLKADGSFAFTPAVGYGEPDSSHTRLIAAVRAAPRSP